MPCWPGWLRTFPQTTLRGHLAANDIEIRVGSQDNSASALDTLKARLDELGKKVATATVNVGDKEALYELDLVNAKLAETAKRVASPRIDVAGAARAQATLSGLELQLDKLKAKGATDSAGLTSSFKRIAEAASGPLTNALKGVGALTAGSGLLSMAAPIGAAGVAVGAFGAVATAAYSKANKSLQTLQAAEKAYNSATTPAAKAAALKKVQQAQDALTGSQRQLLNQEEQIKGLWSQTVDAMTPLVVMVTKVGLALMRDLMPAFKSLASAGGNALETILGYLGQLTRTQFFKQFISQLGQMASTIAPLLGKTLVGLLKVLMQLFIQTMPAGVKILGLLLPLIVQLLGDLVPVIAVVAKVTAATLGWLTQTGLLKPVLLGLIPVIMLLVGSTGIGAILIAVSLLAAGVVEFSQHWKQIWGDIKNWTSDVGKFLAGIFHALPAPLQAALKIIVDIWKTEWNVVSGVAKAVWNGITGTLKAAWAVIQGLFKVFIALLTGNWTAAGNAIKQATTQAWNAIKNALTAVWNALKGAATSAVNGVKKIFSDAWSAISNTAKSAWGGISKFFSGLATTLHNAFTTVVSGIKSAWDTVQNVFKTPVNFLINTVYMGGIRRLWDDVASVIGFPNLPAIKGLSTGGRLDGYGGGDRHLALLESGEAVVDKDRTRKFAPLLKAMGVPGFASGGIVGNPLHLIESGASGILGLLHKGVDALKAALHSAMLAVIPSFGPTQLDKLIHGLPVNLVDKLIGWPQLTLKLNSKQIADAAANALNVPGSGALGGDQATNKALARKMFPWPASMWPSYDYLEMREAGYNRFARNPSSGAYGIPQALPPTKMPFAAQAAGGSHAGPQISWMYSYIRSVYGNPVNAAAHERSHNWYGAGGATSAGWAMVGEHGRELIKVPGGATVYPHGATEQMLAGLIAGSQGRGPVQLEISGGQSDFEKFLITLLKNHVRVKGGGNVQKAFGQPGR